MNASERYKNNIQNLTEKIKKEYDDNWTISAISCNIPNHPIYLYDNSCGIELEINPLDGYDNGIVHKDESELDFSVNVYEYEGDEMSIMKSSKMLRTSDEAVDYAEKKIQEHN